MYAIRATVTARDNGSKGEHPVPGFFLDESLQGITGSDHAAEVAEKIINPLGWIPPSGMRVSASEVETPVRLPEEYAGCRIVAHAELSESEAVIVCRAIPDERMAIRFPRGPRYIVWHATADYEGQWHHDEGAYDLSYSQALKSMAERVLSR